MKRKPPEIRTAAIMNYCRTHLAEYKLPQKLGICETIKKNPTGKTERRKADLS